MYCIQYRQMDGVWEGYSNVVNGCVWIYEWDVRENEKWVLVGTVKGCSENKETIIKIYIFLDSKL